MSANKMTQMVGESEETLQNLIEEHGDGLFSQRLNWLLKLKQGGDLDDAAEAVEVNPSTSVSWFSKYLTGGLDALISVNGSTRGRAAYSMPDGLVEEFTDWVRASRPTREEVHAWFNEHDVNVSWQTVRRYLDDAGIPIVAQSFYALEADVESDGGADDNEDDNESVDSEDSVDASEEE